MKQLQKGFTLIELLIVIAIIGILASIALPAYQSYVAKSQASSALAEISGAKTSYLISVQENGDFAATSSSASIASVGLPTSSTTCTSYAVSATGITCTFDHDNTAFASGETIQIAYSDGSFTGCVMSSSVAGAEPKGC